MQLQNTVIKKQWPKLTIVLWLLVQLPFLTADLPENLSYSRGPFSDEGLNTFAVRNFINSDYQVVSESDNFIKSPVLNVYLFAPFALFQNDLIAGRIAMLLLVAFLFWQLLKSLKYGWLIVLMFAFTPLLFHFSRLMMGDLTSVLIPLVALVVYHSWMRTEKEVSFWKLTFLVFLTSLSVGLKIQGIAVYVVFLLSVFAIPIKAIGRTTRATALFLGSLPTLVLFAVVIFKQQELFTYIFNQVPEYYEAEHLSLTQIFNVNWDLHFQSPQGRFLVLTWILSGFLILMLAAKFYWKKLLFLMPFVGIWLYQFSGMFMTYFPPRYLVGLYVASFVLLVVLVNASRCILVDFPKLASGLVVVSLLVYTGTELKENYTNRQFGLIEMNRKIAQDENTFVMIGSWAPSLNFTSRKQLAYPIWDSYLNFKEIDKPIEYYHADLIIAESNEDDSGGAYKKRAINLSQYPIVDSLNIGKFSLLLYRSN